MDNLSVVFTGGGTGGHVYPNIAIYESIYDKYPDSKFFYLGTKNGAENKIIRNLNRPIKFISIRSRGIPSKIKSLGTVKSLFQIGLGVIKSIFILNKFKPDIVIGSGGYVAAPVLIAASILKIKIFIHEQNSMPGRLNRYIAKFATKIGISFRSTSDFFPKNKTVFTGYPLRRSIDLKESKDIKDRLNIPRENKVLFVFGGSKGARSINRAIAEIVPELLKIDKLTIIISTGRGISAEYCAYEETVRNFDKNSIPLELKGKLIVKEYFDNIDDIYAISDFVVSRAGAGTIEELTRMQLPSILIPKIDLPGDHQILNAKEQVERGGALIIYENIRVKNGKREIFVQSNELLNKIKELLTQESILKEMKQNLEKIEKINSPEIILEVIESLCGTKNKNLKKELKIFYLNDSVKEKSYELIFDNTSFGNSILSDHYLHNLSKNLIFEIRIIGSDREKLLLKLIKGEIEINGIKVDEPVELHLDDRIEIEDKILNLKCYTESVESFKDDKKIKSKIFGSSFGIMISRIGGFFREVVVTALFGAKNISDLYVAGLTISNFMRRIVAENALENAFLPIFMRFYHRTTREKMWKSASSIINFTLLLSGILTILGLIFTPQIVGTIYAGFKSKGIMQEAVNITRLMFPYLFLVTISAIMATFLKAFNRFGIAELSSLFFSVGSITGILVFYSISNIYALGIGILFGGILQILFLIPFTKSVLKKKELKFSYSPVIKFNSLANKKYYSQLAPITGDTFLSKTVEVVDQFLASGLRPGSISFLYFAKTIFRLPFAIVSQAINSVILRDFSNNIALFDKERSGRLFVEGTKINVFILAPLSIAMFILANPIVSLLYGRGEFGSSAIASSAIALQFYSIGLIGWGVHSLTTRIFSARIDIKTSMYLNALMLAGNIALSIFLVSTNLKYAGLALSTSISFTVFALVRITVLKSKLGKESIFVNSKELYIPFFKTLIASFFMIVIMLQIKFIFNFVNIDSSTIKSILEIVAEVFIGFTIYLIASLLLKNTEILIFKKKILKKSVNQPVSMLSPFSFIEKVSNEPEKYRDDFLYKINLYLNSMNWEIRNVGIKLVGIFKDESKIPFLLNLLNSRDSNPFIKRNTINSLKRLGKWNDRIKKIILEKIDDPYFEVRVAAIGFLTEKISSAEYELMKEKIKKSLRKSSIEEKLAYIRLISTAGSLEDIKILKRFYLSSNSLIREELLKLFLNYFNRGLFDRERLIFETRNVLLTSNNMQPHFNLRALVNKIYREAGANDPMDI